VESFGRNEMIDLFYLLEWEQGNKEEKLEDKIYQ
jgi:hypothetical protein